jgi:hypothetical protein
MLCPSWLQGCDIPSSPADFETDTTATYTQFNAECHTSR